MSALGHDRFTTFFFENVTQQVAHVFFIINDKDSGLRRFRRDGFRADEIAARLRFHSALRNGQPDSKNRADTYLGLNINCSFEPWDDAITDCQTEAHPQFVFRGKEGIENAQAGFFRHPCTCIADGYFYDAAYLFCCEGENATVRHCIYRIKDEIDEHVPQFRFIPHNERTAVTLQLQTAMNIRCL